MHCYAFVLASMYRYSWLITFEIFRNFFLIEGSPGGWGQTFLDFYIFFLFTRPFREASMFDQGLVADIMWDSIAR